MSSSLARFHPTNPFILQDEVYNNVDKFEEETIPQIVLTDSNILQSLIRAASRTSSKELFKSILEELNERFIDEESLDNSASFKNLFKFFAYHATSESQENPGSDNTFQGEEVKSSQTKFNSTIQKVQDEFLLTFLDDEESSKSPDKNDNDDEETEDEVSVNIATEFASSMPTTSSARIPRKEKKDTNPNPDSSDDSENGSSNDDDDNDDDEAK